MLTALFFLPVLNLRDLYNLRDKMIIIETDPESSSCTPQKLLLYKKSLSKINPKGFHNIVLN